MEARWHIDDYDYRGQPLVDLIQCPNCDEYLDDFYKACPCCGVKLEYDEPCSYKAFKGEW